MLKQQLQPQQYKQKRYFEDLALYQNNLYENFPLKRAFSWAVIFHCIVFILCLITPVILELLNIDISLLKKPALKPRDIEFVLVNQPEKQPINKNTSLKSDRDTQAGGKHDPTKRVAPIQPALPKSAPNQQANKRPQKQQQTQAPVRKQVAQKPAQSPMGKPQKVVQKPPVPPKPTVRPTVPFTKSPSAMKLPIPPTKDIPKISTTPSGPVTTQPSGAMQGTGSTASPKPIIASGGYGSSGSRSTAPSTRGTSTGSAYSPGGGSIGNPSAGNPNGPLGIDTKSAEFGPYMNELSRRIKANWDPPRGEESKRVVLLFTIAKDGRLLNVKVIKSSGTPAADKAALAAVELTAPFRPLPANYDGPSVDIQFTFDYNVLGQARQY